MKICCLQHVPFEGPARIVDWAQSRGHELTCIALHAGGILPSVADFDLLIVMGGPMGVHDDDRYAWMRAEKLLIRAAMASGKKVLGICLGAQLIACVLGAAVYANKVKEIGWFPVQRLPPADHSPLRVLPAFATVFHWHGDTFDLPAGATHLVESTSCVNQGFAVGKTVIGLQFHLEMSSSDVENLLQHGAADLTNGPYIQKAEQIRQLATLYAPALGLIAAQFLDAFAVA